MFNVRGTGTCSSHAAFLRAQTRLLAFHVQDVCIQNVLKSTKIICFTTYNNQVCFETDGSISLPSWTMLKTSSTQLLYDYEYTITQEYCSQPRIFIIARDAFV